MATEQLAVQEPSRVGEEAGQGRPGQVVDHEAELREGELQGGELPMGASEAQALIASASSQHQYLKTLLAAAVNI